MTFNEEIKQIVKNREERLEKEFEIILRRCLEVLKEEKNMVRVFIFKGHTSLGVIANFAHNTYDCLIGKSLLPVIDDKYLNNKEKCFDDFLCDFEYYLYMNTDFEFHEYEHGPLGKLLCVELPMN